MNDNPSALLTQAQAAARSGDRERARTVFYSVIDQEPDNLDAWLWLGAIADDPEDAVAYLQRALEINPRSIRARHGIEWAQGRLVSEKPAPAPAATPTAPESPSGVLPGVDTSGLQQLTQPLSTYQPSPPSQRAPAPQPTAQPTPVSPTPAPQAPPTALEPAPPAGDQLDWDAIMSRLETGGESATADTDLGAGKRLIEAGDFAAAAAHLRNAVAADPRNLEAYEQLGVAQYQAGDVTSALDAFQRVIALDPQRAEAHANIGFIHAELGSAAAAITAFRRAIDLSPLLVEAMIALGDVLRGQNDWDGALEAYERAVTVNAEIPEALYGLALCRVERAQRPEASFLLRRAIELRPDYKDAWAKLRELE